MGRHGAHRAEALSSAARISAPRHELERHLGSPAALRAARFWAGVLRQALEKGAGRGYEGRVITVYQYPKCSTCRSALKWLDAHGVKYERIDIVASPPSRAVLERVLELGGLPIARLFNTSGQSYREGNFKQRLPTLDRAQALAALASDGKLVKRPLVIAPDRVLVGFDERAYAAAFPAG